MDDLSHIFEQDQADAKRESFADLIVRHYGDLIESGFTPEQAMQLTMSYQAEIIRLAMPRRQDDE